LESTFCFANSKIAPTTKNSQAVGVALRWETEKSLHKFADYRMGYAKTLKIFQTLHTASARSAPHDFLLLKSKG